MTEFMTDLRINAHEINRRAARPFAFYFYFSSERGAGASCD
jgi:hypothetical protein